MKKSPGDSEAIYRGVGERCQRFERLDDGRAHPLVPAAVPLFDHHRRRAADGEVSGPPTGGGALSSLARVKQRLDPRSDPGDGWGDDAAGVAGDLGRRADGRDEARPACADRVEQRPVGLADAAGAASCGSGDRLGVTVS